MTKTNALALLAVLTAGCSLTLDPEQYAPKSASDCGPSQKVCGYKCVANDDPATGCGTTSCQPCPGGANAVATCDASNACSIQCNPGFGDCVNGAADGCEAKLNTPENCGACTRNCAGGSCDQTQGLCLPVATVAAPPEVVSLLGEFSTASWRVFYATRNEIHSIDFSYSPPLNSAILGSLSGVTTLAGGSSQIVFSSDDASGSSLRVFQIYDPLTVKVLSTQPSMPGAQTFLANALGNQEWAWWVPAGSPALFSVSTFSPGVASSSPLVAPATAWRALAVDFDGNAYAADDALGGRILTFAPGLPPSATEVTGAGTVGALAVRRAAAGPVEIYWGDLATGDVIRQVNGLRTTIHHGRGPTTWMRMVADDQGVYWADADNAEVMEYLPMLYGRPAVVPLARGVAALEIAVGNMSVFWSAAGQISSAKR
jgi:hypothetical protein